MISAIDTGTPYKATDAFHPPVISGLGTGRQCPVVISVAAGPWFQTARAATAPDCQSGYGSINLVSDWTIEPECIVLRGGYELSNLGDLLAKLID
ncbi:hypothetical protein J6590_012355 [Homalodisca vitripennis]|nr:hypothetical protein J6590_012355 [Homalodisca vitripennis]